MKKVAKSSQVMEVLNIPNLQRMLERLADLLSKVQKALGEYLERERSSFARYVLLVFQCISAQTSACVLYTVQYVTRAHVRVLCLL